MDQPLPHGRPRGPGGSVASSRPFSAGDVGDDHRGTPQATWTPSDVGREEAAEGLVDPAADVDPPVPEYGLPRGIRTDNGVPFATTALGRLSTLSVWWIRLGILPELIAPASPQQNGRHERMHRTLKAEATRPPSANLQTQQVRFNRFRHEYNHD